MQKDYKALVIKYTTSRGRDTYGYNLVTLYVDGVKHNATLGVGYDMAGTVLGEYLTQEYKDRLKELPANYGSLDTSKGYYGLSFGQVINDKYERHNTYQDGDNISVDGGCGISAVRDIAKAIGLDIEYSHGFTTKKQDAYFITDTRNNK